MKLLWLAVVGLSLSTAAYAKCPAGTQGGNDFEEGVKNAKYYLGQTVKHGSYADERATDGKPVRIQFLNNDGKLRINVFRSNPPKKFDNKEIANAPAEFCTSSGKAVITGGGVTITIEKGAGGLLAVNAAQGMLSVNMVFGPVTGGVDVATSPAPSR